MFDKLADVIMKRAKMIVALWLVILICAVPFALQSSSVMQYDMTKMSSSTPMESTLGSEILKSSEFSSSSGMNAGTIIVVEVLDSHALDASEELQNNLDKTFHEWKVNVDLREKYGPEYQITTKTLGMFDDKYFKNKDTEMTIITVSLPALPDGKVLKATNYITDIRSLVSESKQGIEGIVGTYVTGSDAISYDTMTGATGDIKKIDPISILLVLILIGLFFRSILTAATPPVIIGIAYGILLALVFGIGSVMGIFYITTILVLVSMLGAGCDYCIFIVSRYREERKEGKGHEEALRESIMWAGESIVTSGCSVIIGFGVLSICSFSLVSTMGIILALGIVLALLAALTFIPSLLMLIGDKIFWPSKMSTYREDSKAMKGWYGNWSRRGHRYFTNSAKASIKYAKVIVAVTLLLTVPLAYVVVSSEPSYDIVSTMPDGEAKEGVSVISANIGGGTIMPTYISMKVDAFVDVVSDTTFQSGDVVPENTPVSFTAKPYPGYEVSDWIVDGVSTDTSGLTHTILVGSSDVDVRVVYVKSDYYITFGENDSEYGKVSATVNKSSIVSNTIGHYGNKVTFTATPANNCRVDYWEVNGETVYSRANTYTVDLLAADVDVKAVFGTIPVDKFPVEFSIKGNGEMTAKADGVAIKSGDMVLERSFIEFYATPDTGCIVDSWTVNGEVQSVTDAKLVIGAIEMPLVVSAEVIGKPTVTYTVDFDASEGGSVTATANGVAFESGDSIAAGSKVIIDANPDSGRKVAGWSFFIVIDGEKYPVTTTVGKSQYVINSLSSDQTITAQFVPILINTADVTFSNGENGTVSASNNGRQIESGSAVYLNTSLFLSATPDRGYQVSDWIVDGVHTGMKDSTYSIVKITKDIDIAVEFETVPTSLAVTFATNNDDFGTITASNKGNLNLYQQRSNAIDTYNKFNSMANDLMSMTTDGKNNVAMVIGPMTGDVLFDGNHEWLFDTIIGILPSEMRSYISGYSYDMLVETWGALSNTPIGSQIQEYVNYYLNYKSGFVSAVFSDNEGGQEYQYVKFMVITKDEPMSQLSMNTIKQVFSEKAAFVSENNADKGGFVYVGYLSGAAVSNYEISNLVSNDFNFIIIVVILLLILLLFVVMKSYLTPIRAVFTIVMSVIWTLGLTYLIFQYMFGMPVVWIVPIVLFVVCLGLGMDYDILLTTRIKEYVSKGMSNDDAIIAAIQKSGAVITLCGLIMAGAFGTMILSTSPMLKEFGFALGFAIGVDALVVRTYIVPALMHLMGKWNWKGPDFFYNWLKKRKEKRQAALESE